jgi:hypothetical protein
MQTQPILRHDLDTAFAHLRSLDRAPTPSTYNLHSNANTAFTALECAYIPTGQTDTRLLGEVRNLLAAAPVAPVAQALRAIVEKRVRSHADDPEPAGWVLLDVLDGIEELAADIELSPIRKRWLRTVAYSALVAYGPAGAALPTSPDDLVIDVALVPGANPRIRWCDGDDEDDAGVPIATLSVRR